MSNLKTSQRIAKNFLSLVSAEIISKIFAFFSVIYLARILRVEDFGKISFVAAIFSYFMLITNLGLTTLGTRETAKAPRQSTSLVNHILSLRFILSIISFAALLVFAGLIPKPSEIKLLLICYGISMFPLIFYLDWYFQGIEKMEHIAFAKILNFFIYFCLIVLFIKNQSQLLAIPFLWFIGNLVATLWLIYLYYKRIGKFRFTFPLKILKQLLLRALPMGFSWIMIQIYNNFDTIMLGFIKTEEEVGWYNAAYKIILVIFSLGGFLHIAIFPNITKYYKESTEKLKKLLSYMAKLMLMIALPFAVGGTILAQPLMRLFYTQRYDPGIIAFQILIWYVAISFISMVYANSLLACDREKKYALGVSLAALSNLILNACLIPKFGLIGAAVATVASEFILLIYAYYEFRKIALVNFVQYIAKPLLAAFFTGIILFISLKLNLFLLIGLGVFVYSMCIILLRAITKEEISLFVEQFRR